MAGLASSIPHFLLSPLNLLKTRLQAGRIQGIISGDQINYRESVIQTANRIYTQEGLKAFWNGTLVSSGSIVMIGLFFFMQNTFRSYFYSRAQKESKTDTLKHII